MSEYPPLVIHIGQWADGKWSAFYSDPLDGSIMRGPHRDTGKEACTDQEEMLVLATNLFKDASFTVRKDRIQ